MNWNLGLHRVNAVFWGFWALLAALYSIAIASDYLRSNGAFYALGAALGAAGASCGVLYILYRLTGWIVDGFTKNQ